MGLAPGGGAKKGRTGPHRRVVKGHRPEVCKAVATEHFSAAGNERGLRGFQ